MNEQRQQIQAKSNVFLVIFFLFYIHILYIRIYKLKTKKQETKNEFILKFSKCR